MKNNKNLIKNFLNKNILKITKKIKKKKDIKFFKKKIKLLKNNKIYNIN